MSMQPKYVIVILLLITLVNIELVVNVSVSKTYLPLVSYSNF